MIDYELLQSAGAELRDYKTGSFIFSKGEVPQQYHQILKGQVKFHIQSGTSEDQMAGVANSGQSLAAFSLFTEKPYAISAVALSDCQIIGLDKDNFFKLLDSNPEIGKNLISHLSHSLHYKMIMEGRSTQQDASEKILALMDYLKSNQEDRQPFSYQINMTRQQMANLSGMRVETTIRTIKALERKKMVKIINHKIFY